MGAPASAATIKRGSATALLALWLLVACGRVQNERIIGSAAPPDDPLRIGWTMEPAGQPTALSRTDYLVTLSDGDPIEGAQVLAHATMTHAGMAPVRVGAEALGAGAYRVPLRWTMAGEWVVTLHITLPDGSVLERHLLNVEVVAP